MFEFGEGEEFVIQQGKGRQTFPVQTFSKTFYLRKKLICVIYFGGWFQYRVEKHQYKSRETRKGYGQDYYFNCIFHINYHLSYYSVHHLLVWWFSLQSL